MPIMHRDDSFATMLLTCALSPDREELVHPLCAAEFHELRLLAARAGAPPFLFYRTRRRFAIPPAPFHLDISAARAYTEITKRKFLIPKRKEAVS